MPKAEIYEVNSKGEIAKKPCHEAEKDGPGNALCAEQQLLAKIKDQAKGNRYLIVVNDWPCAGCIEKLKEASKKLTIFVRACKKKSKGLNKVTDGTYEANHYSDIVKDANQNSSSVPTASHESSKYSIVEKIISVDGKERGVVIIYKDGVSTYVAFTEIPELKSHATIQVAHKIELKKIFEKIL